MAVVVVGGQARKVGKTSVMAGLIAAMPEMRWTAMKITQHVHGSGELVTVERDAGSGTDTGRYLAAGAGRSLWVTAERLEEAMPRIREEIATAENVMIESNSILEFVEPDCFLCVLDGRVAEFKESARRYLDRADALVIAGDVGSSIEQFRVTPEEWCPAELVEFVRQRIAG
jgi:hypothetical protein